MPVYYVETVSATGEEETHEHDAPNVESVHRYFRSRRLYVSFVELMKVRKQRLEVRAKEKRRFLRERTTEFILRFMLLLIVLALLVLFSVIS